jgi:Spy/CpxP family protein refolding chaperone
MKTIHGAIASLMLLSVIFLVGPVAAEEGRGHRGNPQKMVEKLKTELDLTEEQVSKVRSVLQSHQAESQKLREQMKGLLTDEQRAALKEMRKNRKGGDGERPSREEMKAKMAEAGVTPEQMKQMRSLREQMKSNREVIHSEIAAILTAEQKTKFEAMKKNRKGHEGKRGRRGPGAPTPSPSE